MISIAFWNTFFKKQKQTEVFFLKRTKGGLLFKTTRTKYIKDFSFCQMMLE